MSAHPTRLEEFLLLFHMEHIKDKSSTSYVSFFIMFQAGIDILPKSQNYSRMILLNSLYFKCYLLLNLYQHFCNVSYNNWKNIVPGL